VPISERPHKIVWCAKASPKNKWKKYDSLVRPLQPLAEEAKFECDFRWIGPKDSVWSVEKMIRWYNSASYVLCASEPYTEGTPNFVTEAVACGCVAVSTRSGNILEWGKSRENCVLAKPTISDLLDALKFARRHRKRLSSAGMETVRTSLDYEHVTKHYFGLCRAIHSGGPVVTPQFAYENQIKTKTRHAAAAAGAVD
jgi:glycosyltransferase involved in cell wall biosynthesis